MIIARAANDPGARALPTTSAQPVVFVVDDDVSVRDAVAALVRMAGWRSHVFASAQDFLDHAPEPVPGCIVLDVNLPDLDGLELQQRITAAHIELPIVFLTGEGDVPMTVRAMKAGAADFLMKPFDVDRLLAALHNAVARSTAAFGRDGELRALRRRHARLSQREREVMALVVTGLLNKQVGGELGISEITVKAHRGRVMRKMQAGSLADLVKMAASLQLEA
jgi:FixJ family two-component response regulator